jgi:hypothetical protein
VCAVPLPVEDLRAAALAQLTEQERQSCLVYLASPPVARGETLSFPRVSFDCPWDGYLTFVDLDPMANWSHACCYICIDSEAERAHRVDAQFPPFGPPKAGSPARQWRVIYRAPGVPEALIPNPQK